MCEGGEGPILSAKAWCPNDNKFTEMCLMQRVALTHRESSDVGQPSLLYHHTDFSSSGDGVGWEVKTSATVLMLAF